MFLLYALFVSYSDLRDLPLKTVQCCSELLPTCTEPGIAPKNERISDLKGIVTVTTDRTWRFKVSRIFYGSPSMHQFLRTFFCTEHKVIFDYLIDSQFDCTAFDYLLNLVNSQFKNIFF